MKLIRTEDAAGQVLCHDITQIIPGEFKGARFRKGHIIQPEDIPVLLSIGKENLYVWEKKPGILHEDEAAALLYKAAAGKMDFLAAEKYAIGECFRIFGLGVCSDEMLERYSAINRKYWERLEKGEITKQETLEGRFREFFASEGLPVEKAEAFNAEYQERLGDVAIYCPHGREVIDYLQQQGIRQYAVTNGTQTAQRRKLANSGLDQIFVRAFISDEIGYEKPDVRFFEPVLQELKDCRKEEILLIGDSLTSDMRGADNAGLACCWYNPKKTINDKGVRIDYEIQDLLEIEQIVGKRV